MNRNEPLSPPSITFQYRSAGTHQLSRQQLIEAIWPSLESEMASNRLDRAVYELRQSIDPSRSSHPLITDRETLALATQEHVWIDACALEQCLHQASYSDNPGEKELLLEQAVLLYGGDAPSRGRIREPLAAHQA